MNSNREKVLAFGRIVGYVSGFFSEYEGSEGKSSDRLSFSSMSDAKLFSRDLLAVFSVHSCVTSSVSSGNGKSTRVTYHIHIPAWLVEEAESFRTSNPSLNTLPQSFVREIVAAFFGACSSTPLPNATTLENTQHIRNISFLEVRSTCAIIDWISGGLQKVNIYGSKDLSTLSMQGSSKLLAFEQSVGFRYNERNSFYLSAACSYHNYIERCAKVGTKG